jgi:hypothetical protein
MREQRQPTLTGVGAERPRRAHAAPGLRSPVPRSEPRTPAAGAAFALSRGDGYSGRTVSGPWRRSSAAAMPAALLARVAATVWPAAFTRAASVLPGGRIGASGSRRSAWRQSSRPERLPVWNARWNAGCNPQTHSWCGSRCRVERWNGAFRGRQRMKDPFGVRPTRSSRLQASETR